MLSIHDNPLEWAKEIHNFQIVNRNQAASIIVNKGFDISINIKNLEAHYLNLLNLTQ